MVPLRPVAASPSNTAVYLFHDDVPGVVGVHVPEDIDRYGIGSLVSTMFAHVHRAPWASWITSDRPTMLAEGGVVSKLWASFPKPTPNQQPHPDPNRCETAQKGLSHSHSHNPQQNHRDANRGASVNVSCEGRGKRLSECRGTICQGLKPEGNNPHRLLGRSCHPKDRACHSSRQPRKS
jgi:hypothetical protein